MILYLVFGGAFKKMIIVLLKETIIKYLASRRIRSINTDGGVSAKIWEKKNNRQFKLKNPKKLQLTKRLYRIRKDSINGKTNKKTSKKNASINQVILFCEDTTAALIGGKLILFLLRLVQSTPVVWLVLSNHSIAKLCCGRGPRRWLNTDSRTSDIIHQNGTSPGQTGEQRGPVAPRIYVRLVLWLCELLPTQYGQRVHVYPPSRKIRVLLSDSD